LFYFNILICVEINFWGSGIWDPISKIRIKPLLDPRSQFQRSKRHHIPNPGSGSATTLRIIEKNGLYHINDDIYNEILHILSLKVVIFTLSSQINVLEAKELG